MDRGQGDRRRPWPADIYSLTEGLKGRLDDGDDAASGVILMDVQDLDSVVPNVKLGEEQDEVKIIDSSSKSESRKIEIDSDWLLLYSHSEKLFQDVF